MIVMKAHKRINSPIYDHITYGSAPFKRATISCTVMLFVSCFMGILTSQDHLFMAPENLGIHSNTFSWIAMELLIPYTVLYFASLLVGWFIISMQSYTYVKWIFKQSATPIIIHYFFMLFLVVAFSAMNVYSVINIPQSQSSDLNPMEKSLWLSVLLLYFVPMWMGYRVAWKSYRELGAKTMQDRYEEKLESLEVKNSGQFWDKYASTSFKRIFGLDGRKPRGGFTWVVLAITLTLLLYTLAESLQIVFLYATGIYFVLPSILFFMMATAKYRDVKQGRHEPFLITVRYPDTVDDVDLSSKGRQRFDRY